MKSDGLSMLSQVRLATPVTNPSVEMKKAASGAPVRQDVSIDDRGQIDEVSMLVGWAGERAQGVVIAPCDHFVGDKSEFFDARLAIKSVQHTIVSTEVKHFGPRS